MALAADTHDNNMASSVVRRRSKHCESPLNLISQRVKVSAEPVTISYQQLSAPESLTHSMAMAFGSDPECLGMILIRDLPETYPELRERLLLLACKFARLDESVRERYSDPSTRYRCDD